MRESFEDYSVRILHEAKSVKEDACPITHVWTRDYVGAYCACERVCGGWLCATCGAPLFGGAEAPPNKCSECGAEVAIRREDLETVRRRHYERAIRDLAAMAPPA